MSRYALIVDNIVVQIQPNNEAGFVLVDDSVTVGLRDDGLGGFIENPVSRPVITDQQYKDELYLLMQNHVNTEARGQYYYFQSATELATYSNALADANRKALADSFVTWRSACMVVMDGFIDPWIAVWASSDGSGVTSTNKEVWATVEAALPTFTAP